MYDSPGWRVLSRLYPFSHYGLLTLLFFAGLEVLSTWRSVTIPLGFLLLGILAIGIYFIRVEEHETFALAQVILPILTAIGLVGFTLFLPLSGVLHAYFIFASLIFFFVLRHGARHAYPTWNWILSVLVYFLTLAVSLGVRYYLYVPVFMVLIAIFAFSFLISFQGWRRLSGATALLMLLAACSAFALTELAWALLFLPLHYSVQAGIVVVAYYAIFHLVTISFTRSVTRKDILEYVSIGGVTLLMLVATARWQ